MNVFYAPNILQTNVLPAEESHHCCSVLRMRSGDEIRLIDGAGGFYKAKISVADQRATIVEVLESKHNFEPRPYTLHLAVAPTKSIDRFEWFVEKAVEIGIDEITPIKCRFSERKNLNIERLQKIILSATKQSLKAYLPKINPLTEFKELVKNATESQKLIAHCYDQPKEQLFRAAHPKENILVMIGPEGDFSEEEVQIALEKGFLAVSLSQSRLRTETAAVVAADTVALRNLDV